MSDVPFLEYLLKISNIAVMSGANLMIQSTIIIAVGICAAYALRNKGAAVQSLVLRVFLVAVFFSFIASPFLKNAKIRRVTFDIPSESLNNPEYVYTSVRRGQTAFSTMTSAKLQNELLKITAGAKKNRAVGTPQNAGSNPWSVIRPDALHSSASQAHETSVSKHMWEFDIIPLNTTNDMKHEYSATLPHIEKDSRVSHQKYLDKPPSQWEHKLAGIYIIFTVGWMVFSIFLLIRLLSHILYIQYIRHSALTAKPSFIKINKNLAHELGLKAPLVFQSPSVKSPFLAGLFKPFILLPQGEQEASFASREVFLHELSHLQRGDHLWNLLRQIGTVILPFQPLIWILSHWIEETSDYVCDDFVLNYSGKNRSYAAKLLNIARSYQPAGYEITAGVGMISFKSPLRRRIERILDSSHTIYLKTGARFVTYISFLGLCTVVLSGFIGFESKRIAYKSDVSGNISGTDKIIKTEVTSAVESVNIINNVEQENSEAIENSPITSVDDYSPSNFTADEERYEKLLFNDSPGKEDTSAFERLSEKNETEPEEHASGNNSATVINANTTDLPVSETDTKNISNAEEYTSDFSQTDASITDDMPAGESVDTAIETEPDEADEITDQNPDSSGFPSFIANNSGMVVSSFRENKIKMPVAKAVNVKVDFDYENFDFDLKNKEDRRLYNLYLGLDKHKNEPAWSPDGEWIAFTDHNRIWIVSPEGGEPELIYENFQEGYSVGNFESLCFTPDSREVTFKKDVYDIYRGSIINIREFRGEGFATFSNPIPNIESVNIYTGEHRVIVEEGYRCSWSKSGGYLCYLNWDPAIYSANAETDHHSMPAVYDS
ncbi:MAG TPA: hypothetical protein ENH82_19230, partial [bacterium]|nr:hypothetical protein [bacterium]